MRKMFVSALIATVIFVLGTSVAAAICPVCTVAVGAGVAGARMLGVDDVITGIWVGALTLSLFFWTASWLKKHGVKNFFLQIVIPFLIYYGLLACVYLLPNISFGERTLWCIDKFLLGIIIGTITFYLGVFWYKKIKAKHGGHAQFPFQKVIIPVSLLIVITVIFYFITKIC